MNATLQDHAQFTDVNATALPTRNFVVVRKGVEINFSTTLSDDEAFAICESMATWSDFALDLVEAAQTPKGLTVNQTSWLFYLAEQESKRQTKKSVIPAKQVRTGLSQIFSTLKSLQSHYKSPVLRLGNKTVQLRVTWAKAASQNAGCIYICDSNKNYLGKVTPDGEFKAISNVSSSTVDAVISCLHDFEVDPKQAVITYGKLTGHCAICGRLLTNEGSVEAGIGPVCASKGGF